MLRGENGKDVLYGLGGDDELEGGAGGDTLDGFDGFDIASYASSNAGVSVDLTNGNIDGGHAAGDLLLNIEGVIGSAYGDWFFGNAGRNVLRGQGGQRHARGRGRRRRAAWRQRDRHRLVQHVGAAVVADLASGTASGEGIDRLFGIENLTGGGRRRRARRQRRRQRADRRLGRRLPRRAGRRRPVRLQLYDTTAFSPRRT